LASQIYDPCPVQIHVRLVSGPQWRQTTLTFRFHGALPETNRGVKLRKVIQQRIERSAEGISVAASLDAVVAANVNEAGASETTTRSTTRIVQRGGRTEVFETESEIDSPDKEAKQ